MPVQPRSSQFLAMHSICDYMQAVRSQVPSIFRHFLVHCTLGCSPRNHSTVKLTTTAVLANPSVACGLHARPLQSAVGIGLLKCRGKRQSQDQGTSYLLIQASCLRVASSEGLSKNSNRWAIGNVKSLPRTANRASSSGNNLRSRS
jgi:hypothetical protein